MASHDRPVYALDGEIFRDVDGTMERLTRNVLGIWEWVPFTGAAAAAGVRVDLADEGFISLYNPGCEQYMMKADYEQMKAVEQTLGGTAGGGIFTRATTAWAETTHSRVDAWDAPLTDVETTPGNVRWRDTVNRIAARAQCENEALIDEERFMQA